MVQTDLYTRYVNSFVSDMKEVYRLNGWSFYGEGIPEAYRQHLGKLN